MNTLTINPFQITSFPTKILPMHSKMPCRLPTTMTTSRVVWWYFPLFWYCSLLQHWVHPFGWCVVVVLDANNINNIMPRRDRSTIFPKLIIWRPMVRTSSSSNNKTIRNDLKSFDLHDDVCISCCLLFVVVYTKNHHQ